MHRAPARSGCFRHDAEGFFIFLLCVWRGFAWFEARLWLRKAASTARGCFSGRSSSAKGHHELKLLGFLLGRTCRARGGGGRGFTWLCAPKMALHGLTGSFPSASDEQGGRRKHRGTTRGSCSTFKPVQEAPPALLEGRFWPGKALGFDASSTLLVSLKVSSPWPVLFCSASS